MRFRTAVALVCVLIPLANGLLENLGPSVEKGLVNGAKAIAGSIVTVGLILAVNNRLEKRRQTELVRENIRSQSRLKTIAVVGSLALAAWTLPRIGSALAPSIPSMNSKAEKRQNGSWLASNRWVLLAAAGALLFMLIAAISCIVYWRNVIRPRRRPMARAKRNANVFSGVFSRQSFVQPNRAQLQIRPISDAHV
ncbi:Uncharacterized protein PBTT_01134 [Plasmodiophora brassicae]|uniref:Uncharacterized protein n=1 Tax=Plasmodiophora brassicae TaxID=37360 RepID=A0A0G4IZV6_PLABS|nr:hypothetical protein PBRA_001658 [Plasmodiophora brassicae]SPQ93904.1 unnamed protein product [Plasmodiophora brassicae]